MVRREAKKTMDETKQQKQRATPVATQAESRDIAKRSLGRLISSSVMVALLVFFLAAPAPALLKLFFGILMAVGLYIVVKDAAAWRYPVCRRKHRFFPRADLGPITLTRWAFQSPFALLATLSLLLCMASMVLAFRSDRTTETLRTDFTARYDANNIAMGKAQTLLNARLETDGKAINEARDTAQNFVNSTINPNRIAGNQSPNDAVIRNKIDDIWNQVAAGQKQTTVLLNEYGRLVTQQANLLKQRASLKSYVPIYELAACMTAILPMAGLMRWRWLGQRAAWRWENSLCVDCGYDLRAHQPGDRCPECGTVIPAETKQGNIDQYAT